MSGLAFQLQFLQVELHGVDRADLPAGFQHVALLGVEPEDAPRGLGRHDHFRSLERSRGVEIPAAAAGGCQERQGAVDEYPFHKSSVFIGLSCV